MVVFARFQNVCIALGACAVLWAGSTAPAGRLAQAIRLAEADPQKALPELDALLGEAQPAMQRVDALIAKGRVQIRLGQMDGAERTAELAAQALGVSNDDARRLDIEHLRCAAQFFRGEYAKVIDPCLRAFEKADRLGLQAQMARLANLLGAIHGFQGEMPAAIDYYLKSLRAAEAAGDVRLRLQVLHNLASLYLVNKDPDRSLECTGQGLALAGPLGDKELLGGLLLTRATGLEQKGRIKEELTCLREARNLAHQGGFRRLELGALGNWADLNLNLKHFDRALALAEEALAMSREFGAAPFVISLRVTRAQALSHLGRRPEAIQQMRAALKECQSQNRSVEVMQIKGILADTLQEAGRYREALAVFRSFKDASDAILQKERQDAVARYREFYEAEKREREIATLNAENALVVNRKLNEHRFAMLGGAFLVIVALLFYLRQRSARRATRKLQELNARLEELSWTDTLTGLKNRRYLHSRVEEEAAHARRLSLTGDSRRLGVLLMDLDHFKRLNDTEGHLAGDAALKLVTERLLEALRKEDILVRWGGEEFLVLSREMSLDGLRELAQRLVTIFREKPFMVGGKEHVITCSLGYTCFPMNDWMNWERSLQLVDTGLYWAKARGRDQAVGIYPGTATMAPRDFQGVLEDLAAANENGLIRLV